MLGLLRKLRVHTLSKNIIGVRASSSSYYGNLLSPVAPEESVVLSSDDESDADNKPKEETVPATEEIAYKLENAFKTHNMKEGEGPATNIIFSKQQALEYFRQMQTIRRLENAAGGLYKEKIVRGFCHLYLGQEAVCVGMGTALRPIDSVITAYRAHGWAYMMGLAPAQILSELTGRKTGCSRGKGGSMHMYAPKFYGGNGIVGAQVSLGTGIAMSAQHRGDGSVCVTCYGDGASNQGQVFESFNMACLWKLPVIFVCENNMYGMGTPGHRATCHTDYYTRGFNLPGIWVDGMRVLAVRSAAEYAVEYAPKNGPILLEMSTYRYSGHSMSDPGTSYRSRDEVQEVRAKRDPIARLKDFCTSVNLITPSEFKSIDDDIKKMVDEAVKIAKSDKEIELKELTADVYSKNLEPNIRGITGYNMDHIQINKGANH